MKKAIMIFAVILSVSLMTNAQTLPTLVKTFLKKNYADRQIAKFHKVEYQENKSTAKGDFNGDGKPDYAIVITKDNRVYTLVLFAAKTGFKAVNLLLAQGEGEHWIAGVGIVTKGAKLDVFNNQNERIKSVQLKTDAVYLYDGEGHGRTYYWENGKFRWTNDF